MATFQAKGPKWIPQVRYAVTAGHGARRSVPHQAPARRVHGTPPLPPPQFSSSDGIWHRQIELQQTAGRLRQGDGAPSASWPAQAGHPRLAVLVSAEGVDGGPSAAMTIRTDRPSSSGAPTYLRFAVALSWRTTARHGIECDTRRPCQSPRVQPGTMQGASYSRVYIHVLIWMSV